MKVCFTAPGGLPHLGFVWCTGCANRLGAGFKALVFQYLKAGLPRRSLGRHAFSPLFPTLSLNLPENNAYQDWLQHVIFAAAHL